MRNILNDIVENKRREVEAQRLLDPMDETFPLTPGGRSMSKALAVSGTGIIAEFKRRSPSKGDIHPMAMVGDIVPSYASAGATACSILTDTPYFGGALTDLAVARGLVDMPLLRKDFVVDGYQILQAARYGADAVLLIATVLTPSQVSDFTHMAHSLGVEVLLELHNTAELDRFTPEVDMVGINNRDLSTFKTDPALSLKMASLIPDSVVKIAESGLTSMDEVSRLRDAGYRGFLIGETFMRHQHPGQALAEFLNPTATL